jgi:superfamily II DNA/RNA helicase
MKSNEQLEALVHFMGPDAFSTKVEPTVSTTMANITQRMEKGPDAPYDCQIMVCTDKLARGFHLPGLKKVINFDFPRYIEAYMFRAGRTGRGGQVGHGKHFFTYHIMTS